MQAVDMTDGERQPIDSKQFNINVNWAHLISTWTKTMKFSSIHWLPTFWIVEVTRSSQFGGSNVYPEKPGIIIPV